MRLVEKPIFILGTGRSGTTVLGKVLSMHPHVGFLNEPKALWHAIYPNEDVIGSYSRGEARYRLTAEDATVQVRRSAHRLYRYYLTVTGSRRVLDKYPEMIFRVPFLRTIFPDAKFIFLVRNGWDTVRSIGNWSRGNEQRVRGETHNWWGIEHRKWNLMMTELVPNEPLLNFIKKESTALECQEEKAAVEWIVSVQEGLRLLKRLPPECFYLLYYEQLVENPDRELHKLLKFCELPEDNIFFAYAQRTLHPTSSNGPLPIAPPLEQALTNLMFLLGYSEG